MDPSQVMKLLIGLGVWSVIATTLLILAKRDVKLGLKKFFLKKLGKEPIIIRYHGANKRVREMVIGTKKLGEVIEIRGKKFFFFKDPDGETFFIDTEHIIQRDDDINELSYNFSSVMPIDPTMTEKMVEENKDRWLVDLEKYRDERMMLGKEPVDMEKLRQYTDPRRLNKFVDYVYLVAKENALRDANNMMLWVKIAAFCAIGALCGVVFLYYTIDGKVIPVISQIAANVQAIGMTMKSAIVGTVTA